MPTTPLTIAQLEQAINRARSREPATGSEYSLSSDVSLLGTLYGRLIFRNRFEFDPETLSAEERDALSRWLPEDR